MFAFLGLALFAMVATGFGTGGGGIGDLGGGVGGGQTLASVGGEELTVAEVTDQVNRQLAAARAQRPDLDIGTFLNSGAYEQIIDQMIAMKALVAFGREHGIGASKKLVDGEIASIPAFRNLAGQFDDTTFRRALQAEKMSEEMLREDIETSLFQRQILLPVSGSAKVPLGLATQYATLLLETRTGEVGLVPTAAMGRGNEPTTAEINAFYKEQRSRYTIPERRVLRYAAFGTEQVAAAAKPTEAEIAAFYRSNPATYAPSESRVVSQVVLPDEAAARAFAAKIAGGTSFDAAAQAAGFSAADTAIGRQSKAELTTLTSAAVANAAFAAAKGATTQPARSAFGWHIVRIDDIVTTPGRPLAAVRTEIETQLGAQKVQTALADMVARIEDSVADGSSFDEVAKAERLTIVETPAITVTGAAFGGGQQAPAEAAALLKPGFEMDPEEDPLVETIRPNQRYALLAVGRVIPAAPAPLADIQDQVKSDLVERRANLRARSVASAILAKVNAGTPMRQAFAEAGMTLPPPAPVNARRMDISRNDRPVPPTLAMLFSLPKGGARLLEGPLGWHVVHLSETVQGDASKEPGLIEATRAQFGRVVGDEYAQQFGRAIERQLKVKRNDGAIARLKAQMLGAPAQ